MRVFASLSITLLAPSLMVLCCLFLSFFRAARLLRRGRLCCKSWRKHLVNGREGRVLFILFDWRVYVFDCVPVWSFDLFIELCMSEEKTATSVSRYFGACVYALFVPSSCLLEMCSSTLSGQGVSSFFVFEMLISPICCSTGVSLRGLTSPSPPFSLCFAYPSVPPSRWPLLNPPAAGAELEI